MDVCGCGAPLDFSPDGKRCLSCSEEKEVRLERRLWCVHCQSQREGTEKGDCEECGEGLMYMDAAGEIVGAVKQVYYCENEECFKRIDEDRYLCAGCYGWFCSDCARPFPWGDKWVCEGCRGVWINLYYVRGVGPFIGGAC